MANSRRLRRGVVKQLSNLSIDEVSLVDRGANQHALISIAKRAPEAADYFEKAEGHNLFSAPFSQQRKANYRQTYKEHPRIAGAYGLPTGHGAGATAHVLGENLGGMAAGAVGGAKLGHKIGGEGGALAGAIGGGIAGSAAGGAHAGQVVHNHYYGKRAPEETLNVDDLFSVEKKGSFGQGGNQAKLDSFSGDDPAGVTDDENGESGDVGPGKKISGVETTEGEDTPPQKSKKKGQGGDINPTKLSGLGKSKDFWKNVVSKVLDGEFETDGDEYGDDVGKHFPGGMGAPQNPMQSPFPGAQGAGMAPTMQTPGVQPMGMGQPTPPSGGGMQQPGGGMGQALPPDVVQYIQQLEQALDQLTGGGDDSNSDNSDDSSSTSSGSSDDNKKNPFGKSLETSDMDETTFLTELAKSLDDDGADSESISKALEIVSKAEQRARQAEEIAKSERDLRLEREFVAKAAEFNLPVKADDLGPVLKRAAENLDAEDFKTIVKCLRANTAAADMGAQNFFGEVGKRGGGDNADVMSSVEAAAQELVGKSADITPEAATLQVLADNPRAYDEYMRDHPSRRMFR